MKHLSMYTSTGFGFSFYSTNSDQFSSVNQYPVGELAYLFLCELLGIPWLAKIKGLKVANATVFTALRHSRSFFPSSDGHTLCTFSLRNSLFWKTISLQITNNPSEGVSGQFNLISPLSPNNKINQVNKSSRDQVWTRLEI